MQLLPVWNRLSKLPFGKRIFSCFIGEYAPYSGTMGAQVLELKEGRAVLQLKECRKLRNHLNSMHAVALMNLAELTSGLAVTSRVPPTHRGIVKAFKIDFEKKARGKLTAKSEYLTPIPQQATDLDVHVEIFNELGERVCKATTLWRIGPILDTVNQG